MLSERNWRGRRLNVRICSSIGYLCCRFSDFFCNTHNFNLWGILGTKKVIVVKQRYPIMSFSHCVTWHPIPLGFCLKSRSTKQSGKRIRSNVGRRWRMWCIPLDLRRKIGDGYIETVVGSGYRFVGQMIWQRQFCMNCFCLFA